MFEEDIDPPDVWEDTQAQFGDEQDEPEGLFPSELELLYCRPSKTPRQLTYQKSIIWLGFALGLHPSFNLSGLINDIRIRGSAPYYHNPVWRDGGSRVTFEPIPILKLIQTRINRLLERQFPRPTAVFGFSGGSCLDVAKRHWQKGSTLRFDIRHAFFSLGQETLFWKLCGGRKCGFSKSVADIICRLCTYHPAPNNLMVKFGCGKSFLPQGAPSSPRLFDLGMKVLDRRLTRIAERFGGVYSRYADNIYFSTTTDEFNPKLRRIILCEARRKGFRTHKIWVSNRKEMCRILGYNVADPAITTTRDFRRKLRGALYVLEALIDRGEDHYSQLSRVNGMMAWGINLPDELMEAHERCLEKLANLDTF